VVRITETRLLTAMTKEEIFAEATSIYDSYVEALEPSIWKRCKPTREIFRTHHSKRRRNPRSGWGLCCVARRPGAFPFSEIPDRFQRILNRNLDAYDASGKPHRKHSGSRFVQSATCVIRQQQEAIRELSTPVLHGSRAVVDSSHHRGNRSLSEPGN